VRYTELPEIGNLLDQTGERPGMTRAGGRMVREAADVHFIDHDIGRIPRGRLRAHRCIAGRGDDRAQALAGRVARDAGGSIPSCIARRSRPRIEQLRRRIEALPRAGHAPRVVDPWRQVLHIHVPEEERAMDVGRERNDLERFAAIAALVQTQFCSGRIAGEDGKVDAARVRAGARRRVGSRARRINPRSRSGRWFLSNRNGRLRGVHLGVACVRCPVRKALSWLRLQADD
jgi:hypothetical protein